MARFYGGGEILSRGSFFGLFPVRHDLIAALTGPLPDELKGAGFQTARQDVPVDRDRGAAS
jgi:hypothetical protein